LTDRSNRKAAQAHHQAAQKIEAEFAKSIEPRQVSIIANSFNSTPVFTNPFVAAALVRLIAKAHEGMQELKNIGIQLEGIREELDKQTLAKIAGYEDKGFGLFVYEFIQTEIDAHSSLEEKHFFYVYNSDTVWIPRFETLRQARPLPRVE
jgi:hypothetical protein